MFLWTKAQAREAITAWTRLIGERKPSDIRAGTVLFREGESAREVFLLTQGLILLTRGISQDREEILGLRLPGQLVDCCSHTLSIPYSVTARAITHSMVFRISATELQQKKASDPQVATFFERALSLELYRAATFIGHLKMSRPAERLKNFVRFLAAINEAPSRSGKCELRMPLPDEQIAGILGLSARQFKRIKKQMCDEGFVELRGLKTWVISCESDKKRGICYSES
jgi:CRP-like cAMP-binding protein